MRTNIIPAASSPQPDEPFSNQNEADPQTWNLHSYVRNNSLNSIDPDGRQHCEPAYQGVIRCWSDAHWQRMQEDQRKEQVRAARMRELQSQREFDQNPYGLAFAHQMSIRANASKQMIGVFAGASLAAGASLYAAGAYEAGFTTLELSGGGDLIGNDLAGEIIGWGTGQEGVAATEEVTSSLTQESVKTFAEEGLTKSQVQKLIFQYGRAIAEGGSKAANAQLLPRYQLMMKIFELWPK